MIPVIADRTSAFCLGRTLNAPTIRSSSSTRNTAATVTPAKAVSRMHRIHARRFFFLRSARSFFLDSDFAFEDSAGSAFRDSAGDAFGDSARYGVGDST